MSRRGYYLEVLWDSLYSLGIADRLSHSDVAALAEDIWHARDMEAEAHGDLYIPNPVQTELDETKRRHAKEIKRQEDLARKEEARLMDIIRDRNWTIGELEIEHEKETNRLRAENKSLARRL